MSPSLICSLLMMDRGLAIYVFTAGFLKSIEVKDKYVQERHGRYASR